jgi:mono/diheme cytochrome c family protein
VAFVAFTRTAAPLLLGFLACSGCEGDAGDAGDRQAPPTASTSTVRPVREISDPVLKTHDRCLTCHSTAGAIERGEPTDDSFRLHSAQLAVAHPAESFGCAVCHGGTQLATDKQEAHGGDSGLLIGVEVQSRCARCHAGTDVDGTEVLQRGLRLMQVRACFACHTTPIPEPRKHIAPGFAGLAKKLKPGWLPNWLLAPGSHTPLARMPHFYLSEADARAISAYLLTLPGPDVVTPEEAELRPNDGTRAEARALIERSACLDCHRIGRRGGSDVLGAPDLTSIGRKVQTTWLVSWLRNPRHFEADTAMPVFRFNEPESRLLADYLTSLDPAPSPDRVGAINTTPELRAEGEALVASLGCLGCHAGPDERPAAKMGPDLSRIGDRDPKDIVWGLIERRPGMGLADYLRLKLLLPRSVTGHDRMPNFRFTPEEARAVTVALLSFSEHAADRAPELAAERLARPGGLAGELVERFACFSCHAMRGHFGQVAPDLGWEGNKVRREWLAAYLREPYDLRPDLDAEMPRFGLSNDEAVALADAIMRTWVDPEVAEDPFLGEAAPLSLVEDGKRLFWDEWECQGCHMVGGEGESSGPPLDNVGARLQPGWIYQWMRDSERFFESDMPNLELDEEEALAVTAYLLSLRD